MRNPETKEQADRMILDLEKQNEAPDLGQTQIDENNEEIERIRREWLLPSQ